MERYFTQEYIQGQFGALQAWAEANVLVWANLAQLGVVVIAFAAARIFAPKLKAWEERIGRRRSLDSRLRKVVRALAPLALPVLWLAIVWLAGAVAGAIEWPRHILTIVISLLAVWIVIRLTSQLVRNPALAKFIAVTAWTVAALNIVGLLEPTIVLLDGIALKFGDLRLSVLNVLKGLLALILLVWFAFLLSRILENRIQRLPNLTPTVQVLFTKLFKILLITIAVLVALNSVGIDLTALAVFGGAVGVGIGFGLQKIVSNFVSGIILLLDKSIKPGDVVVVKDTFGWIKTLGARYVSIITRDGSEHLVPNEDLITNRVENWSHSDELVRFKIPVGVSYGSDVHKAREVAVEAAKATERILDVPPPVCHLVGFGDSSVDLELRVWIRDPQSGVTNVLSKVRLAIWDAFQVEGIEFPFPQRDLHLRTAGELPIRINRPQNGSAHAKRKDAERSSASA